MGAVRILHGADLHLELTRYGTVTRTGNSRIDDAVATLGRFVDTAIAQHVDLAVLAGDTWDHRLPGPYTLAAVARAASRLRAAGIPLVIEPGNHDGPEQIGSPDTHTLAWVRALELPDVWVPLVPEQRTIETRSGPVHVTAVPYPHKRALDAEMEGVDPDLRVMEAARRIDALIESLMPADRTVPTLFVGHLTVTGSRLGSERLMRAGWDVSISAEQLERGWDYVALGHIHTQQRVSPRVWYAGSMEYVDHAEAGQKKGWLLAEVAPGVEPTVTAIPSGARPLGVLEIVQEPDGSLTDTSPASWYAGGPIIRLRLRCAYRRPSAQQEDALRRGALEKGASYADTEIVLEGEAADYRATRPEVEAAIAEVLAESREGVADSASEGDPPRSTVADLTMADALRVWLKASGKPLEPALAAGTRMIAEMAAKEGRP